MADVLHRIVLPEAPSHVIVNLGLWAQTKKLHLNWQSLCQLPAKHNASFIWGTTTPKPSLGFRRRSIGGTIPGQLAACGWKTFDRFAVVAAQAGLLGKADVFHDNLGHLRAPVVQQLNAALLRLVVTDPMGALRGAAHRPAEPPQ